MSRTNSFENELQALESIYGDDLRIEGNTLTICVHSLQNDMSNEEIDAQIDLELTCPENYPEKLPDVAFKNCRGLSNKQVNTLEAQLEAYVITLKGEPMIYNLVCFVLDYLLDNNRPRKKSCYDEMMCRKEQELARFKLDEVRKMKKVYDAKRKMQQKLEETNSSDEDDFENKVQIISNSNAMNECEKNNIITCNPAFCHCSKYIHFNQKVLRGQCIEHHDCCISYCALDTTTGEQLTVHEWILKPSHQANNIQNILKSIENEFNYLKKLYHENLNSYIDFKCMKNVEKDENIIYIAEKFISNVTLKTFIKQSFMFDMDFVQFLVQSVLKAMLYLHEHKVVLKNLSENNIYFDKLGNFKIASYSTPERMDNLFRLCQNEDTKYVKADQKTDIKQLGLILEDVLELTSKQNDSAGYNEKLLEFKDFIGKCLIKNEERRWGARELVDHSFLKNNSSYEASGIRKQSHSKLPFKAIDDMQDQIDLAVMELNSRFPKDFTILDIIGKGSFGTVWKVRNKLDRQIYAIKEIKLDKNNTEFDKKIIREVKLLSKLKHENVVRYYGSWIETYSETENMMENNDKAREDNGAEDEEDDEDDEDDDDDDDTSSDISSQRTEQEESSFIVFQKDSRAGMDNINPCKKRGSNANNPLLVRTLYISMEFCEKSTLKYAIKNNLCDQEARHWRLLREIVEGLTYIHKQGLIHRDLKPDNIFLDSKDHVKIGDFGLAKIRGMSKCTLIITGVPHTGGGDNECSRYTQGDSDTAGVGTSYYVAPEIDSFFEKSHYNEKVDIYSLGIIFFEMCHPPFNTGMERHDILMKLRRAEIVIPPAMEESMPQQMELVRKLLNRDPVSRPTSQEILEDHVPPAEVEFEELKDIIRKTLISPETKGYKYLISSCLNQKTSIDEDIAYQIQNFHPDKFYISLEMVKEVIENIFKSHGAVYLSTLLLLPQNDLYANVDARVKLMTQSGAVVNLPYDLRVPFARYVTSKNIRRLRRYTIDRVHREQKLHCYLPKELHECAFDIVSPKPGNVSDELEILSVMDEIVNSIPSLKTRNCVIVLNHALILKALLIYFRMEKLYGEIFRFLMDAKSNKCARRQLETNLLSLELGTYAVNTLVKFFGKEFTIYALKEELLTLFSNRKDATEKAEKGFNKLITIIKETENYGISIPIKIRLDVVCNTEYCCDVMFDIVCKTKQKRGKQTTEVIMSGCRYDELLRNFRKLSSDVREGNQSAIGVSISLDKIVSLFREDNVLSEQVVVCSTDFYIPTKDKLLFIKELRESGIKCYFEDAIDNMDELMEYCGENKIAHIVNLNEENGLVFVLSWDANKCLYREKKISRREVAEYILKNLEDQGVATFQRSENRTCVSEVSTSNRSLSIHIMSEEKSQTRRKYENQIKSKISPILRHFSSKTRVEVVGVDLDEMEIARLAMHFKYDDSSCLSKILSAADRFLALSGRMLLESRPWL